jgi:phosphoglycerol transferase MdoB-like AlkP superfamily enzyme
LNQKKTPFYSCLFTLSSHHPYTLPNDLKGKFTEGTLPIHKSIQYVDFALRHFFEQAAKTNWYKNTVFVLTADHSSENEKPYFQTSQGKFQIPFLVFKPGSKAAPHHISRCVSQLDVLPIALTELQIPDTCFGFGSYPNDSFAVQFQDGYFQLVQYPWVYQFDGKQALGLFNVSSDSLQVKNLVNTQLPEQNILDKKMKAVIQQYCNRLKNNQTRIH